MDIVCDPSFYSFKKRLKFFISFNCSIAISVGACILLFICLVAVFSLLALFCFGQHLY